MMRRYSARRTAGFTLVEMIVVLVIIAILASLMIPAMIGYAEKAEQQAMISEGGLLLTAAQSVLVEAYAHGTLKPTAPGASEQFNYTKTGYFNLCSNSGYILGNQKTCGSLLNDMYTLAGCSDGKNGSKNGWYGILWFNEKSEIVLMKYQSGKQCALGDKNANAVAYVNGYIDGVRYDGKWIVAVWKGKELVNLSNFKPID